MRREVIKVRRRRDVEEEVLVTPRGPVIGPALDHDLGAISIRATWLDARPAKELLQVHKARSFKEFRSIFHEWPLMSLNMLYANVSGTIGWQLVGEAPRRHTGWGTMPRSGSDPHARWLDGTVPFEQMPHAVDPPDGLLATANSRPATDSDAPFLGVDWLDGYRLERIGERLSQRRDWDVPGALALQTDQQSLPWREMRDTVLSVDTSDPDVAEGVLILREWDGCVAADSAGASVFEMFLAEIAHKIAVAKAPNAFAWALGAGFTTLMPATLLAERRTGHLVRLLREQPDGWFEDGWADTIGDCLGHAVRRLRAERGPESSKWLWRDVRPLTLQHPMGRNGLLARVFNRGPFPWGGDTTTIGHAKPDPREPTANPLVIASMRMVLDVGNWDASRFSLPGGQSGNPFSPHYDDLLRLWRMGEGVPIAWSEDGVQAATRSTLRLLPEPPSE